MLIAQAIPHETGLICYQVLQGCKDARSRKTLQAAYERLQTQARDFENKGGSQSISRGYPRPPAHHGGNGKDT